MKLWMRVASAGLGLILLGWFAYAHFDQTVNLKFGLFTIRAIPLSVVIYLSVIAGMLAIVAVGLRGDLRHRDTEAGGESGADSAEPSKQPSGMTSG